MLSWSAAEKGWEIDIARLTDDGDVGIEGGPELVGVARAALGNEPDSAAVEATAEVLGGTAAVYAAAIAGAFELLNRAVDATGLPVGRASRSRLAHIIDALEMHDFPHAHL